MLGDHVHKGDVQSPKIYWFIMVYHHFPDYQLLSGQINVP